jgi:hypothetical protein
MKAFVVAALLSLLLVCTAGTANAIPDDYDDSQSNPLRVAAYLIYPAGFTLEWLIFRPFHLLVSQPYADRFFGHRPHEEVGTYR